MGKYLKKDKSPVKPSELLSAKISPLGDITKREMLMSMGSCEKCSIRSICEKRELMTLDERRKGCSEIRELYMNYMKAYSRPEALMIKRMSEIGIKLALQQMKDSSREKTVSREYLQLIMIEKDFFNMLLKYGKGTHSVQEIIVRKGEDFDVDPKIYENIQEGVIVDESISD